MFIESTQVSGNASMQSANDIIKYFLLSAHHLIRILKAIILIDKFPYIRPIVIRKRFDVSMNVKVLSFIISLILHMPYPPIFTIASLILPQIQIMKVRFYFLRVPPKLRNVLVIASANCTTLTFTDFVHCTQLAFLVNIKSDDFEVFSLNQLTQCT